MIVTGAAWGQNPPEAQRSRSSVAPFTASDLDHHGPRPDYFTELALGGTGGSLIALPPPPPGEPPAQVRALYVNAWSFGSSRFYDLVRLADTTEVNALVIDVKDDTGYLTYRSNVPTAVEIGANDRVRAADVRERLALLHGRGIHPIARIVVAKDPLLAIRKPGWAVRHRDGGFWHDRIGSRWVDAYTDSVWIYAAELAAEAVMIGFQELQFDYLRFPDEPRSMLDNAIFPGRRQGESQRAAVRRNVALMREMTLPLGVPFTLDIFGLTASADGDLGIGQVWDDLAPLADVVLPMVYPSHYRRGTYGIAHPNASPYQTVRRALEDAVLRNARLVGAARIRPYLQAFSIFRVRYTPEEIRAQIRAAEDVGISEWVLWNARSVYPAAALRPDRGAVTTLAEVPATSDTSRR
ncbi:MAG TPA: putative glycoside hydrolase [Gemmatimonadales bacterium]|nr:putative glycoside hydrolase [Gemmatimonadales bacterium]